MEKENLNEEFEALDELHKNELDDIVLEKYEKKEKLKKYAIVAGSLLAFFFVVVMIVKVVSDSSSAPQDSLVEEQIAQQTEPDMADEEFEEVPVVAQEENVSGEESLDSVIKEVLSKEQALALNEKSAQKPIQETPKQTSEKKTEKSAKRSKTTAQKPKTNEKKPVTTTKKAKSSQIKQKPKSVIKATPSGHYFIQVGAFLKQDPDKKFLAKIKSNGFHYVIKTFNKNGKVIKRVYIGPFQTKNEAKKALPKVKKTITSGAFVVRL
jgi:DedD protein